MGYSRHWEENRIDEKQALPCAERNWDKGTLKEDDMNHLQHRTKCTYLPTYLMPERV